MEKRMAEGSWIAPYLFIDFSLMKNVQKRHLEGNFILNSLETIRELGLRCS